MRFLVYIQIASSSRLTASWGQESCYKSFVFTLNSHYTAAHAEFVLKHSLIDDASQKNSSMMEVYHNVIPILFFYGI